MIQVGIGKLSMTNHFRVMEIFLETAVLFFGQNK